MTIEEQLKNLILSRYGTVSAFTQEINMSYSTLATVLKNGIMSANINTIIKICDGLNISTDSLANGKIIPNKVKPIQHIELDEFLSLLIHTLENNYISYNDTKLNPNEIKELITIIQIGIEFIKQKHTDKV